MKLLSVRPISVCLGFISWALSISKQSLRSASLSLRIPPPFLSASVCSDYSMVYHGIGANLTAWVRVSTSMSSHALVGTSPRRHSAQIKYIQVIQSQLLPSGSKQPVSTCAHNGSYFEIKVCLDVCALGPVMPRCSS